MKKFLLTLVLMAVTFTAAEAQTAYAQLNNHVLTFKYGTMPTTGTTYSVPLNATSMSQVPWYPDRTEVTKVVFDNSFANVNNLVSIFMWFANMSNLTEIQGIQNLNTSHVINMMSTFAFTKLSSIDLTHFVTEYSNEPILLLSSFSPFLIVSAILSIMGSASFIILPFSILSLVLNKAM